jgi:hypothetical protein
MLDVVGLLPLGRVVYAAAGVVFCHGNDVHDSVTPCYYCLLPRMTQKGVKKFSKKVIFIGFGEKVFGVSFVAL